MNNFSFDDFVAVHKNQLESSAVPSLFWKCLFNKLIEQRFDAGEYFKIELIEFDDLKDKCDSKNYWQTCRVVVINNDGISVSSENNIFIVDHFWTYRIDQSKTQLLMDDSLRKRCSLLLNIDDSNTDSYKTVDEILSKIWQINQCYSIKCDNIEDSLPLWYVMDEFGSRISHSLDANFRCVPFYFVFQKMAYSLLFPIRDVFCGEVVTRNFIEGGLIEARDMLNEIETKDENEIKELIEKALLIPWSDCDLSYIDCCHPRVGEKFFRTRRVEESEPLVGVYDLNQINFNGNTKFKVYTDYHCIKQYLTHPSFEITKCQHDADIWWINAHFKDYYNFSKNHSKKYINQFPFEHVLTVKDLFAITARRKYSQAVDNITLTSKPHWLATTYNLQTELLQFISFYQRRAKKNLDNHWIVKPWNLARGLDTVVTNNLSCIISLRASGPKIACKYIEDPVLFKREDVEGLVKFDIRYIVLLKSVKPLKIFVYNKFWLRFANKPYSLTDLDDYEKHFTVMNYAQYSLKKMYCDDFIVQFNQMYAPQNEWHHIQSDIFSCIKDAFENATLTKPPSGLGHSPQSRAMYAVDLMLKWEKVSADEKKMTPILLEINWSPDCERACLYYPNFFNHVFSVLFLNQLEDCDVTML